MQILIATADMPYPPASGGALRAYGLITGLCEAGHRVTLLTFGEGDAQDTPLHDYCERVITVPPPQRNRRDRLKTLFFSRRADIQDRLYSHAFRNTLVWLLNDTEFDLVQFEGIEIAGYLPLVREHSCAKICFDTFNAEADLQHTIYQIDRAKPRRWLAAAYSWVQSRRIARYEGELCEQADLVVAVSPEDAALLRQYRGVEPVRVVPSGIFVEDYDAPEQTLSLPPNALVYTGKMDYRPNVDAMLWFTEAIFPRVAHAHLTIVGQQPHPRLAHLSAQDTITLTGWVDSVLPYLHAAEVYIAPLRMGSGTRLKILEAMAAGCAIVATSITAAGLNDEVKAALTIADDETAFADAITRLLNDPDCRAELGQRARQQVRSHYDWSALVPHLLEAYEEVGLG